MKRSLSFATLVASAVVCVLRGACAQIAPPASTPKGYVIAEIAVNDAVMYREYVAAVTPLIAKNGGVYLVRGGNAAAKEGAAR